MSSLISFFSSFLSRGVERQHQIAYQQPADTLTDILYADSAGKSARRKKKGKKEKRKDHTLENPITAPSIKRCKSQCCKDKTRVEKGRLMRGGNEGEMTAERKSAAEDGEGVTLPRYSTKV